ncbi:sensor histidine kinase, partial [Clostridium sp.]|uniref:sensor histidine kinase n=1 Tax=Clostridium sp. TaxID=1506 RepID=UPI003464208B
NEEFEEVVEGSIERAANGKAVVNLKYINNSIYGVLTYPLYINDNYLGIVTINKNYKDLYSSYEKAMQFTSLMEVIVFLIIFILIFLIIGRITDPITKLTEAVNMVGEGDYDISIDIKSEDEVGILANEFISMKDKIQNHIENINLQKEKVEKLEVSRREFFNNVTHELKTPLTSISGYAEMLKDEMVKDEEFNKRAIERIYSESERLHGLVLDLIEVSKGLSNVEKDNENIDMKILLSEICDDMTIKAEKYSLKLCTSIKEGYIFGQSNRIRELIINIIDNAIKYSKDNEEIIVNGEERNNYYNIEVSNKGGPIPEEIYNHIFEPFIKSAQSREKQSRGLGLYICSEISKEHKGHISIENGELIKVKIEIPSIGNNLETSEYDLVKTS